MGQAPGAYVFPTLRASTWDNCFISSTSVTMQSLSGSRRLVAGLQLYWMCSSILSHRSVTAAGDQEYLSVEDLDSVSTGRSNANDLGFLSAGRLLAYGPRQDDGKAQAGALIADGQPAPEERVQQSGPPEDAKELPSTSEGISYQILLTSMEALRENGAHVIAEEGEVSPHPFPNLIASPSLAQVFGKSTLAKLDLQLSQKGLGLQDRKELALTRYNGVDSLIKGGRCRSGGVYLFVKPRRTSSQDDEKGDSLTYHFEAVDFPSELSRGMYFSIPANAVELDGGRGVDIGRTVLLACLHEGDRAIIFTNATDSLEEMPESMPGPFEKNVEVLHAEAFVRSEGDGKSVLMKMKLADTSDGTRHSCPFIFLGTLPEPGIYGSAFVLGSLKKDRKCTLRRREKYGPVILSCRAWESVGDRAKTHARLGSAGRTVRKWRWIAAGVVAAMAALSAAAVFMGFRDDREDAHFDMVLSNYDQDVSALVYGEGVSSEVPLALADSADPRNIRLAFRQLGDPENKRVARAVLLRGAGVYGTATAALTGLLAGTAFLGEKFFRSLKRSRKFRWLQQHTRKAIDRARSTSDGGELAGGAREKVILYVVSP